MRRFSTRRKRDVFSRHFVLGGSASSPGTAAGAFPLSVGVTDTLLLDVSTLVDDQMQHAMKKLQVLSMHYQSDLYFTQNEGEQPVTLDADVPVLGVEGFYVADVNTNDLSINAGVPFWQLDATSNTTDMRLAPGRTFHRRYASLPTTQAVVAPAAAFQPLTASWRNPGWNAVQQIRRRVALTVEQALFYRWEIDSVQAVALTYHFWCAGVVNYRLVL